MIILHDSDGRPYYEAIEYYCKKNGIELLYYENHVFMPTIKNIVKLLIGRKPNWFLTKRIFRNLWFRIKVPFVKNETIILGFAPYNFRIIWYQLLLKNNNLIYHTSHPDWTDIDTIPLKYGILKKIFQKIWKKFLENPKLKIVCVTKQSENSLKKMYNVKSICQIYHTINYDRYQKHEKISSDKIRILFVGKIVYQKGLDTIIELVNRLPEDKYEFTIVGDGEYRSKIEYIFKKENVNYLGWIGNKDELAQIYVKQDIFLNPSYFEERFGLVIVEAMASGLVVIASNHSGPREIITNNTNGFLVKEKNYKGIIKIINELEINRDIIKQISQEAKKRAKDFDISVISNKWEKLIDE